MSWLLKNALIIVALFCLVAWFFRYDYRTRTIKDVTCIVRINRFTGDRCLYEGDALICTKISAPSTCNG